MGHRQVAGLGSGRGGRRRGRGSHGAGSPSGSSPRAPAVAPAAGGFPAPGAQSCVCSEPSPLRPLTCESVLIQRRGWVRRASASLLCLRGPLPAELRARGAQRVWRSRFRGSPGTVSHVPTVRPCSSNKCSGCRWGLCSQDGPNKPMTRCPAGCDWCVSGVDPAWRSWAAPPSGAPPTHRTPFFLTCKSRCYDSQSCVFLKTYREHLQVRRRLLYRLLCVRNLVLKQNNKSRMWAPPHPVSLDFLTLNIPLSPASVTSLLSPRVLPFDSLPDWIAVSSSPVAPSLASSHLSLPYMAVSAVCPPFGESTHNLHGGVPQGRLTRTSFLSLCRSEGIFICAAPDPTGLSQDHTPSLPSSEFPTNGSTIASISWAAGPSSTSVY